MRLNDNIDSGKGAGLRFTASLEAALPDASGNVLVPAGTKVLGIVHDAQSAGRVAGKSELEIAFTDLQINGLLFPIQSQGVKAVGEGSGRDTARKVGAAALIGGAFGGGSGAAKGAAIGGAAAVLTRGKEVRIPAGTVLELSLVAPARVPAPAAAVAPVAAAPVAAAPVAAAPAAAPAGAAPAPAAAAAPTAAAEAEQKACVKKLMANGFTADEALASCNKKSK
jgi:type IV secretory pathway VirB10-like protein